MARSKDRGTRPLIWLRPTAALWHRHRLVALDRPRQAAVHALIQKHPHAARIEARNSSVASSKNAIACSRVTVGNPSRKSSSVCPPLDAVDQRPHRHPCPHKHRLPAKHLRVSLNHGPLTHRLSIALSGERKLGGRRQEAGDRRQESGDNILLRTTNYELRTTNYQLPTTNYELRTTTSVSRTRTKNENENEERERNFIPISSPRSWRALRATHSSTPYALRPTPAPPPDPCPT